MIRQIILRMLPLFSCLLLSPCLGQEPANSARVNLGQSTILQIEKTSGTIIVGDPKTLRAENVGSDYVAVTGLRLGKTTIVVGRDGSAPVLYDVHVGHDKAQLKALEKSVMESFSVCEIAITTDDATGKIHVEGVVPWSTSVEALLNHIASEDRPRSSISCRLRRVCCCGKDCKCNHKCK